MEKKEIIKIVYVTEDGKEFEDEKEAIGYETEIKMLREYEVKGPENVPGEPIKLRNYNYKWYKVNNNDELDAVLGLLKRIYKHENIKSEYSLASFDNRFDSIRKFPEYIGYSSTFKKCVSLNYLKDKHKNDEQRWQEFLKEFERKEN